MRTAFSNVIPFGSVSRIHEENWKVAQTIVVTGVDDDINDRDVAARIRPTITTSDPAYADLEPRDITVVNVDNDELLCTSPFDPQ